MKITEKPDGTVTVDTGRDGAAKGAATWDGETISGLVAKADPERRFTLAVAYPAMRADASVAADGHRDFISKDALWDAAHNFLRNGAKCGLWHEDGTEKAGEHVQSFLWPDDAPDWKTSSGYTVKSGDWMVGTIWSPEAWSLIKSGKIGGVSMQGKASRRKPAAEVVAALRSDDGN